MCHCRIVSRANGDRNQLNTCPGRDRTRLLLTPGEIVPLLEGMRSVVLDGDDQRRGVGHDYGGFVAFGTLRAEQDEEFSSTFENDELTSRQTRPPSDETAMYSSTPFVATEKNVSRLDPSVCDCTFADYDAGSFVRGNQRADDDRGIVRTIDGLMKFHHRLRTRALLGYLLAFVMRSIPVDSPVVRDHRCRCRCDIRQEGTPRQTANLIQRHLLRRTSVRANSNERSRAMNAAYSTDVRILSSVIALQSILDRLNRFCLL